MLARWRLAAQRKAQARRKAEHKMHKKEKKARLNSRREELKGDNNKKD